MIDKFLHKNIGEQLREYNSVNLLIYDSGLETFDQYEVGDNYVNYGGYIDIFKFFEDEELLGERSYNVSIELRRNIYGNHIVNTISDDETEIIVIPQNKTDSNNEYWNEVKKQFEYSQIDRAFFIHDIESNSRYFVFDVISSFDGNLIFKLATPATELSIGDEITIYELVSDTEIEDIVFVEKEISQPSIVLKNHRRHDLNNFEYEHTEKSHKFKTFEEVKGEYDDLTETEKINISKFIDVDYFKFEKFVRFGSAIARVVNYKDKLNKSNVTFTVYEEFLNAFFDENNYTDAEKSQYLDELHNKAIEYDSQNHESIIQSIEPSFLEEDSYGYLTNFITMMGEFFDDFWVKIESILRFNSYTFEEFAGTPHIIVQEILRDLGFDSSVNYDSKSLQEYFSNHENFDKVTQTISKRFLFNLIYLYKTKGTKDVIYAILNIFGIQRDLLEIVEFGKFEDGGSDSLYFEEYDWMLNLKSDTYLTLGISNVDFDQNNNTIEITVKTFKNDSGVIFSLGDSNVVYERTQITQEFLDYKEYILEIEGELTDEDATREYYNSEYPDSTYDVIKIGFGDIMIYVPDNNLWHIISLSKENNSVRLFACQNTHDGSGIINRSSLTYDNISYGTFQNIQIGNQGSFYLTEFRIFESYLNEELIEGHLLDVRSVTENSQTPSKIFRYKAFKGIEDFTSGDFTMSFHDITLGDFEQEIFYNSLFMNNIFDDHFSSQKIRSVTRSHDDRKLNRKRKITKIDDVEYIDSDKLGIYIALNGLLDKDLIRIVNSDTGLVPNDLETESFSFDDIEVNKKYYNNLTELYGDLNQLYAVWKMINRKIFKVLQDFVPVGLDLHVGIMIRNNIISKNRNYKVKNKAILDEGFRSNIIIKPTTIERVQSGRIDILFDPVKIGTDKEMSIIHYEENFRLLERNADSLYLMNIENDVKMTPWTNSIISGTATVDAYEVEENQGGRIKVTY